MTPDVVLPGGPFQFDLTVAHQCAGGVPFADPEERGSGLGAALHAEEDPAAGGRIPTDVRCDGDTETAFELLGREQAGELLRQARLGQGQHLPGMPEQVGVGRRGPGEVRDGGSVPDFDGVEGTGVQGIGAGAGVIGGFGWHPFYCLAAYRSTACCTRADADQRSLQVRWEHAVDG